MAEKIRRDGRVHVLERTNLRYLSESEVPQKVDLVTLDLSFISILMVSSSTLLTLNFMAITFIYGLVLICLFSLFYNLNF